MKGRVKKVLEEIPPIASKQTTINENKKESINILIYHSREEGGSKRGGTTASSMSMASLEAPSSSEAIADKINRKTYITRVFEC